MKATPDITNLAAGEVDPRIAGRTDLKYYYQAAKTLENLVITPEGAADKRGGLRLIAECKNGTAQTVLIPFIFGPPSQNYQIEAGDLYFRFYVEKAQILDGSDPYEIVTPYAAADVAGVYWCHANDESILCHKTKRTQILKRFGATNWTIGNYPFFDGPYLAENATATTLTAAAATGSDIAITASATDGINGGDGFKNTDIGRLVRLGHLAPSWAANTGYSAGDFVCNESRVYECATAGTSTASVGPTGDTDEEVDGTAVWAYRNEGGNRWGWGEVSSVPDATHVHVTVKGDFAATTATVAWQIGFYSDTTGWPAAAEFHENRLNFFATTNDVPQRIDGSMSADFEIFTPGVRDDQAIAYALQANKMTDPSWLISLDQALMAATGFAEFAVRSTGIDTALTPTNAKAQKPNSRWGARPGVPAVIGDNDIVFLQSKGKRLLSIQFDVNTQSWAAANRTRIARHILGPGADRLAHKADDIPLNFVRRIDGQVAVQTYLPEEDLIPWCRMIAAPTAAGASQIMSVSTNPGDTEDDVYMIVKRTINGVTKQFVEVLEPSLPLGGDIADAFYVDCGVTYDGAPETVFTAPHLIGEMVQILADGASLTPQIVDADGHVTLPTAKSKVQLGLKYTSTLELFPLEAGAREGTAQAKVKIVGWIYLNLFQSAGGRTGPDTAHLDPLSFRGVTTPLGSPAPLFTGWTDKIDYDSDYDGDGNVIIVHDDPLPFTICSIVPRVWVADD